MMNVTAHMTLTYFPARGTCDKIRLVLAESGLNYVEKNVTGAEFRILKKQLLLKTLPMLEEGSLVLFHSNAILRYLADKAGLYGYDTTERAECDMWAEQCELIQQTLWNAEFMKYSEIERQNSKIEEMRLQFYKKELKPLLNEIIAHLSKKEFPFLVGQKITFVDLFLFSVLDSIDREIPTMFLDYPLLQFYHSRIGNRPKIQRFRQTSKF